MSWGDAREGRIEWQPGRGKGVAPTLVVSGAVALNAEPPVYVDEARNVIGPVQLGLPPRLACQFLAAPSIPRAQLEEVSRRLSQRLPELHHGLLPVPPAAAVLIDEDPRPVLRLKLGHVGASYYYYRNKNEQSGPAGVASLGFRYGGFGIDPSQRASRLELFQGGQVYAIVRRQPKERQARKRLADAGLIEARSLLPMLDYRHAMDFTLRDQHGWFDFLALHAEQLRSEDSRSWSTTIFRSGWRSRRAILTLSSSPVASTGSNCHSASRSKASGAILRRCWPRWFRRPASAPNR